MANWNKSITLRVRLPYISQGCTLEYNDADIEVLADSVWFLSADSIWKSEQHWGDHHLLVIGKATPAGYEDGVFLANHTTHKVRVYNTHDGFTPGNEEYEVKVLSYN